MNVKTFFLRYEFFKRLLDHGFSKAVLLVPAPNCLAIKLNHGRVPYRG